jgi:hypothetical protein
MNDLKFEARVDWCGHRLSLSLTWPNRDDVPQAIIDAFPLAENKGNTVTLHNTEFLDFVRCGVASVLTLTQKGTK